jgi:hypothetical protein
VRYEPVGHGEHRSAGIPAYVPKSLVVIESCDKDQAANETPHPSEQEGAMKRTLLPLLLGAGLILVVVGVGLLVRQDRTGGNAQIVAMAYPDGVARIEVSDLAKRLQGPIPPLVWELRPADSFAQAHIPGSTLVTFAQLDSLASGLDRSRSIVTVCD